MHSGYRAAGYDEVQICTRIPNVVGFQRILANQKCDGFTDWFISESNSTAHIH